MTYFEYNNFSSYFDSMTLPQIQEYMHNCLRILKEVHGHGIIHRDIKPQNILYNSVTSEVTLIDFGCAIFHSSSPKSTKIGSKFYKAPEVVLNYQYYDYGIDIWNLGLVFASLVFRIYPFLYFQNGKSILDIIFDIWGDEKIFKLVSKYRISLSDEMKKKYFKTGCKELKWFFYTRNIDNRNKELFDLLTKMLTVDPYERITAQEALKHPFFLIKFSK